MKRRGHEESTIRKVVYENPLAFFRQCARWHEWETKKPVTLPPVLGLHPGAIQITDDFNDPLTEEVLLGK